LNTPTNTLIGTEYVFVSKLIPVGVWNGEDGGISYYNMMEHLDKHCGVICGDYESSEGYVSEAFSVGESALDILMEAWNKDTNGKQLICPVGGARSARPIFNYLAIYFLLSCAQDETDGEKMMERTPAEETPEGNKKTSFVLSDGALGNTCVCSCTMCVSEEMDYIFVCK
jgi:hypothetical protein